MTEEDIYSRLSGLADGKVYPYVVKLNEQGKPAVGAPWVVFSLSSVAADVLCGPAEETVSLQIDVYARTLIQARSIREQALDAVQDLMPSQVMKQQFPDRETGLIRAMLEVQIIN